MATMWWVFSAMSPNKLETLFKPIEFEMDMETRKGSIRVPGVFETEAGPITNPGKRRGAPRADQSSARVRVPRRRDGQGEREDQRCDRARGQQGQPRPHGGDRHSWRTTGSSRRPDRGGTMARSGMAARLLGRDRAVVLVLIGVLFALAAVYTVLGIGMDRPAPGMTAMPGMPGTCREWAWAEPTVAGPCDPRSSLMWWVMMTAMMLPSVAPTVLLYSALLQRGAGGACVAGLGRVPRGVPGRLGRVQRDRRDRPMGVGSRRGDLGDHDADRHGAGGAGADRGGGVPVHAAEGGLPPQLPVSGRVHPAPGAHRTVSGAESSTMWPSSRSPALGLMGTDGDARPAARR